jgi:hypothetical protein
MKREGVVHPEIILRFAGKSHRIDLHALSGGKAMRAGLHQQHSVRNQLARHDRGRA